MKMNQLTLGLLFCFMLCTMPALSSDERAPPLPSDSKGQQASTEQANPPQGAISQSYALMIDGINMALDNRERALADLKKQHRGIKFSKTAKEKQAAAYQWIAQQRAKIQQEKADIDNLTIQGVVDQAIYERAFWAEYEKYVKK